MPKVYVKCFDNEGNIVVIPFTDEDPVPPIGYKPAESYTSARNRNCKNAPHNRFRGSVLFFGR